MDDQTPDDAGSAPLKAERIAGEDFVLKFATDAERKERRRRRSIFVGAGLALLAAGEIGAWSLWYLPQQQPVQQASPAAIEDAAAQNPEFAAWSRTNLTDPASISAYLKAFPNGAHTKQAQDALGSLDELAWAQVKTLSDAQSKLNAIDVYDLSYPQGRYTDASKILRQATADVVALAERALNAQGYNAGAADGVVSRETTAAVRAYQSAKRIPATGLIDPDLVKQVLATSPTAGDDIFGDQAARESFLIFSGATAPASNSKASEIAAAAAATDPTPFRDCYSCPEMVRIPPGKFVMGDITGAGEPDERPAHTVTINYTLAVSRFEVTFDDWEACVTDGGCPGGQSDMGWGRGHRPIINVNWTDATQYAAWLSKKTGKPYRLLSEAEWEYAARAGSASLYSFGDDPKELCTYANHADSGSSYAWKNNACTDNYPAGTAPVGSFKPNAFGLYDMHGNVWEWIADCPHDTYAGAPNSGAAWTTNCAGTEKLLRGGAWSVRVANLRAAYRYRFDPKSRFPFFGFRVAR